MKLRQIFISLLAKEILGKQVDEQAIRKELVDNVEKLNALYSLSKMHDFAHIICLGLKNIGIWGKQEVFEKFLVAQSLAIYRYEQQVHEYGKVAQALEQSKIPYIALKGVCMREYYPEGWMRTSSDTDILVKKEDKKRAVETIINNCGFEMRSSYKTETSLVSKSGMCIELHHTSNENSMFSLQEDVWEYSVADEGACRYVMAPEMFYFHQVAHMAKHQKSSGCGIKPFVDIYLLNEKSEMDRAKVQEILERHGLAKAEKVFVRSARVWFDGLESDELTDIVRKRVLMAGSYGNDVTFKRTLHSRRGGKIGFILWLFLPDRQEMERRYPVLKEHPRRLPLYHIKRWGHLIFKGRIKSSAKIVGENLAVPTEEVLQYKFMLKEMGLE